jgi:hypothetical protein
VIKLQMPQEEVYAECGQPVSIDLRGIKGERWEDTGMFFNWSLFVGFTNKKTTHSSIYVDIGVGDLSIRANISDDGKLNIGI